MIVTIGELAAMDADQVGICMICGSLDDPVAHDACGLPCTGCGRQAVVGLDLALSLGAVKLDLPQWCA